MRYDPESIRAALTFIELYIRSSSLQNNEALLEAFEPTKVKALAVLNQVFTPDTLCATN
jgi:hypothetical protein